MAAVPVTRVHKEDGRVLLLFGAHGGEAVVPAGVPAAEGDRSHLRWHPLRGEWVVYAPHRLLREGSSRRGTCVLCPTRPGDGFVSEVPVPDFDVAIFENRFASFHLDATEAPGLSVPTAPARGVCEVVVYSPDHERSLGDLSRHQLEVLVGSWIHRYEELYAEPGIELIYVFENRGPGIGGSLTHPHGQIYAMPYLPLVIEQETAAFRKADVLLDLLADLEERFVVVEDDHHVVFVPPFARYAYEVWIVPRRRVPGPWAYTDAEIGSFAHLLGDVYRRFDVLAGGVFPFMMILHAAPAGEEDSYHFHVEFYPPHRPDQKVRPHTAVEFGMWVHLLEAPIEDAVEKLRSAASPG